MILSLMCVLIGLSVLLNTMNFVLTACGFRMENRTMLALMVRLREILATMFPRISCLFQLHWFQVNTKREWEKQLGGVRRNSDVTNPLFSPIPPTHPDPIITFRNPNSPFQPNPPTLSLFQTSMAIIPSQIKVPLLAFVALSIKRWIKYTTQQFNNFRPN